MALKKKTNTKTTKTTTKAAKPSRTKKIISKVKAVKVAKVAKKATPKAAPKKQSETIELGLKHMHARRKDSKMPAPRKRASKKVQAIAMPKVAPKVRIKKTVAPVVKEAPVLPTTPPEERLATGKKRLVALHSDLLHGYPLLEVVNSNFAVYDKSVIDFKIMKYHRPLGFSKLASVDLDVFLDTREVVHETVFFEFDYSENERIENAKRPESFKIRPEWFYLFGREIKTISIDDIIPKYSDVKVVGTRDFLATNSAVSFWILFTIANDKNSKKIHSVNFSVSFDNRNIVNVLKNDSTMQVDVLKSLAYLPERVTTLYLENVRHYIVDESFVRGAPPQQIDGEVVKPKPYIQLLRVDYIPPKDVDSVEAVLMVTYRLNRVVAVERLIFRFGSTIRNAAEATLAAEPRTNFQYLPTLRRVAPPTMNLTDFVYIGNLDLDIINVNYDYNAVNTRYRFVDVEITVAYRLVMVKVLKRIEFLYSRDEYLGRVLNIVFLEENSVQISKRALTPQFIYGGMNDNFEFTKTKDLIENIKILPQYSSYKSISSVVFVNFHPESRKFVFRISVIEQVGQSEQTKVFDKPVVLEWSYQEWMLESITDADLHVTPAAITPAPTSDVDNSIFLPNKKFEILAIKSDPFTQDDKRVNMEVTIAAGVRTRVIRKAVMYQKSINEQTRVEEESLVMTSLLGLRPQDISLIIDVDGAAPSEILPEQVMGIPNGVEMTIKYRPPHKGKRSTRLLLEFRKGKFMVGFEQTLVFAIES